MSTTGAASDPLAQLGRADQPRERSGEPLVAGRERARDFVAAGPLLTDIGGMLGAPVLSTPGMIGAMERNAAMLAWERLPRGLATVGVEVCVRHVAAALEGSRCRAHARLVDVEPAPGESEVGPRTRLRYEVEVREGDRQIGFGMHERRVIAMG